MNGLGRPLIMMGLVLIAIGLLITFAPKLPTWLGRLPGDISIKRDNFSFHFPIVTCLIVSVFISLIMWLLKR
jgi:Protein of unknown function (DUF2905)